MNVPTASTASGASTTTFNTGDSNSPATGAASSAKEARTSILVWDLPVRLGHWLMVAGFVVAWLTSESERWRLVHAWAGGTVVGVLTFRLVWGFIGSAPARFANFVRSPLAALNYLKDLLSGNSPHYTGHNPAGAWAIVLLIGLGLAAGLSGWATYQEIGGKWLEEGHEFIAGLMLTVVAVHLIGVAVGSWAHRENLPRSMVTGMKLGRPSEAISSIRIFATAVMLTCAVTMAWWLSR